MIDILLDRDGDIALSAVGDISLTDSVRQAVLIRLRWIYGEWRFGPELGFPWFEEAFVKNPAIFQIKGRLRSEILKVPGVSDATIDSVDYAPAARTVAIRFTVTVGEEQYREELKLNG